MTLTTTDDAAVEMKTKVWGCLVVAKLPDCFRGGGNGGARGGGGGVRVVVKSICGGREVILSVNVNVYDNGRCGCQCGDEGMGVSCGGEGYQTGSEAEATAEQRGSGGSRADRVRLCEALSVGGVLL